MKNKNLKVSVPSNAVNSCSTSLTGEGVVVSSNGPTSIDAEDSINCGFGKFWFKGKVKYVIGIAGLAIGGVALWYGCKTASKCAENRSKTNNAIRELEKKNELERCLLTHKTNEKIRLEKELYDVKREEATRLEDIRSATSVSTDECKRDTFESRKMEPINAMISRLQEMPDRKPLVSNIIKEGDKVIIFSRAKAGKSTLGFQIGLDIALGRESKVFPSTGVKPESQSVILYDKELNDQDMKDRYGDLSCPECTPFFLIANKDCRFESANELLSDIKFKVQQSSGNCTVIVDNKTAICNDLSASHITSFFDAISDIQEKANEEGRVVTFIIIGHTNKCDDKEPLSLYSMGGSSNFENLATVIIAIGNTATEDEKYIKVWQRSKGIKMKQGTDAFLVARVGTPYLHIEYQGMVSENEIIKKHKKMGDKPVLVGDDNISTDKAISDEDLQEMHRLNTLPEGEGKLSTRRLAEMFKDKYGVSHTTIAKQLKAYRIREGLA